MEPTELEENGPLATAVRRIGDEAHRCDYVQFVKTANQLKQAGKAKEAKLLEELVHKWVGASEEIYSLADTLAQQFQKTH